MILLMASAICEYSGYDVIIVISLSKIIFLNIFQISHLKSQIWRPLIIWNIEEVYIQLCQMKQTKQWEDKKNDG